MASNKNPKSAPEECPRWDSCCSNNCPLAPGRYKTDPSDPMTKCGVAKSIRLRIGTKWKLPNQGLKSRELSARKRWDELPEEVKAERIVKLKKISPITRLSEKGYTICPKKNINRETHKQNAKNSDLMPSIGVSEGGLE